jgi:hypothetical protein
VSELEAADEQAMLALVGVAEGDWRHWPNQRRWCRVSTLSRAGSFALGHAGAVKSPTGWISITDAFLQPGPITSGG